MFHKYSLLITLKLLFFGFIISTAAYASNNLVWYEPTNLGVAGGYASDFNNLFATGTDGQWASSQKVTDVLMLRYTTLRNIEAKSPGFIKNRLVPFFQSSNLKLAIDSTAATWLSCRPINEQQYILNAEVAFLKSLSDSGVKISFISMQSTLSKNPNESMKCKYPVNLRIKDIITYMTTVRTQLPQLAATEIGLIDASLAKGNEWVIKNLGVKNIGDLFNRLLLEINKNKLKLAYVHLDQPWETIKDFDNSAPSTFNDIVKLQRHLKNRQIDTGILLTTSNSSSEKIFNNRVQQVARTFVKSRAAGRHFVLASWSDYPLSELPETAAKPSRFPFTKVLLQLGTYLNKTYK